MPGRRRDDSLAGLPAVIRTVPVFGYAFSGRTEEAAAAAASGDAHVYRLVGRDREITLTEGDNFLGRGPDSLVWIDDESVSRRLARISIRAESTFRLFAGAGPTRSDLSPGGAT